MYKALLVAVLFGTAIIPAVAARDSGDRRGLQRAVVGMVIFNFVYLLGVTLIYPRICWD
jgi:hypothetical protein